MCENWRFWLPVAGLALALGSCAPIQRSGDPFAGTSSTGGRNRPAVRVELEVACNQCLITWSAGSDGGTTRPERFGQVWSMRMVRYPISAETIWLTAASEHAPVQMVRILVNGRLVAIDENDESDALAVLCVTAIIPPPEDAPEAMSGGCAGR